MCEHTHDSGCVGVEVPDVYDGVLWWMCSDGHARPRFDPVLEPRRYRLSLVAVSEFESRSGQEWPPRINPQEDL